MNDGVVRAEREGPSERFFEFFTANIRNRHTRRAYYKAVFHFAELVRGQRPAGS